MVCAVFHLPVERSADTNSHNGDVGVSQKLMMFRHCANLRMLICVKHAAISVDSCICDPGF